MLTNLQSGAVKVFQSWTQATFQALGLATASQASYALAKLNRFTSPTKEPSVWFLHMLLVQLLACFRGREGPRAASWGCIWVELCMLIWFLDNAHILCSYFNLRGCPDSPALAGPDFLDSAYWLGHTQREKYCKKKRLNRDLVSTIVCFSCLSKFRQSFLRKQEL